MNLQEKIINNWTHSADNYSNNIVQELNSQYVDVWKKLILEQSSNKKTLNILDVGTGPGFFAIIMAQEGHEVTAIDCTEEMLNYAENNAKNQSVDPLFKLSDGHKIDAEDNSYDLIISRNLTWTLIDAKSAYKEWKRVLRPDGKIIIFDANWNMRYFDKKYMEMHLQDLKNYEEIYNKPTLNYNDQMHDYRKSMPMCSRLRPQWDIDTFINLGFSKITCDLNVWKKVWDKETQVLFGSKPLFMIVVEK